MSTSLGNNNFMNSNTMVKDSLNLVSNRDECLPNNPGCINNSQNRANNDPLLVSPSSNKSNNILKRSIDENFSDDDLKEILYEDRRNLDQETTEELNENLDTQTSTITPLAKILTTSILDIQPLEESTSILSTTGLNELIKDIDFSEKIQTIPIETTTLMLNLENNSEISPSSFEATESTEKIYLNTETSEIPESAMLDFKLTSLTNIENSTSSFKSSKSSTPVTTASIINKTETSFINEDFNNETNDKEIHLTKKPVKLQSVFDWLSLINDDSEKTIYESFDELLDYKNQNKEKSN